MTDLTGYEPLESYDSILLYAGNYRFRPIIMTSMTTIFGLIPMALGKVSFIGMNYSPIGKIVIGGLLTSSLLMLFVVPVVYKTLDEARNAMMNFIGFVLRPINIKRKSKNAASNDFDDPIQAYAEKYFSISKPKK